MFSPQTSFIPVSVALTRYVEAHGFGGNYPFWYLGSTPVKYLTGPIMPTVMLGLHRLLPNFSFFDLSYLLLIIFYLLRSLGWGLVAARLSGRRQVGWWVGGLLLILPWHIFWGLAFGEVSAILATALTPWVLLAFARISNFKFQISNLRLWLPSLALALLLLINTAASIPAIVGLLILGLVLFKHWDEGLKKVVMVVVIGWLLSLFWYGPGYYLTIFRAPSFGGKSVLSTFISLVNSLRYFVPTILAIVVVFWRIKPKSVFDKFTFAWLVIFGSMTLFRFLADPDFWLDWSAWLGEIEVGLALMFGYFLTRAQVSFQSTEGPWPSANGVIARSKAPSLRENFILLTLLPIYLIAAWFLAFQNRDFWLPRKSIEHSAEFRIAKWLGQNINCPAFAPSTTPRASAGRQLSPIRQAQGDPEYIEGSTVNCPTVFLSGTSAFWLNALVDVVQVRGGVDQASKDTTWRQVAWEIREGTDGEKSLRWLRELGINYLVVHTDESGEFYDDFKFPEKFEGIDSLRKIYEEDGDIIYQVIGSKESE